MPGDIRPVIVRGVSVVIQRLSIAWPTGIANLATAPHLLSLPAPLAAILAVRVPRPLRERAAATAAPEGAGEAKTATKRASMPTRAAARASARRRGARRAAPAQA